MKLKINILIILIFIGFNSYSQNVTGSVYASVFDYTMINESSHEFSFTTYFSMGGGNCPPFSSAITFSGDTLFVKATYNICGFWPALGCVRNDIVNYTEIIPENIQYIIMSTNVITCESGTPDLVENVYTRTYDRNLNISEFLENSIALVPNPAQDIIMVTSANNIQFESYVIYSLLGEKVIETSNTTISVENLAHGIYILEARKGSNKVRSKFVKQ